ncbi:MAG: undecaprenyldiphospho-muramoylpentapeptide beta-N-acetylglucosaminyltransferase [Alphaproteobacteria bacterium]
MTNTSKSSLFLITTGGTGGHIFPAQALAETLRKRGHPVIEVIDQRALQYTPSKESFILHLTSGNTLLKKIRLAFELPWAFARTFHLILKTKPQGIIGFGGYTTFPLILAATLLRKPFILHEQNAFVGRVSKWFCPFAKHISSCFPTLYGLAEKYQNKVVVTGNPIREKIRSISPSPYKVFTKTGAINLLIIGGSQGARSFSTLIPEALNLLPSPLKKRLHLVQQAQPQTLETTQLLYKDVGIAADLKPFFTDIHTQYQKAHLIITRSGASTVMELEAVGRPAIFIPFPYAMDDHQTYNALNLTQREAGWMIKESPALPHELCVLLENLFSHPKLLENTATTIHHLAKLDANDKLADILESFPKNI